MDFETKAVYVEILELRALPVDSLAEEFETPNLQARLVAAGITTICSNGRPFVVEHDWKRFVHDRINHAPVEKPPETAGGWNSAMRDLLLRYPKLQLTLDGFLRYLDEQAPEIKRTARKTSITLDLPNMSRAGLYLHRPGVWLWAKRNGQIFQTNVTEPEVEHYAAGLKFLRDLPVYQNATSAS